MEYWICFQNIIDILNRLPDEHDDPEGDTTYTTILELARVNHENGEFTSKGIEFWGEVGPPLRILRNFQAGIRSDGNTFSLGSALETFPVFTPEQVPELEERLDIAFPFSTRVISNIETSIIKAAKGFGVNVNINYNWEDNRPRWFMRKVSDVPKFPTGEKLDMDMRRPINYLRGHIEDPEVLTKLLDTFGTFLHQVYQAINVPIAAYCGNEAPNVIEPLFLRIIGDPLHYYQSFNAQYLEGQGNIFQFKEGNEGEFTDLQEYFTIDAVEETDQQAPQQTPKEPKVIEVNFSRPSTIITAVNPYVIGQERGKQAMAEAVCDHHNISVLRESGEADLELPNVIMIGPTGSGKTYMVRTIAEKVLDAPFADDGLATKTAGGYVGGDIASVFNKLVENSGRNLQTAEQGIVFLDEFDKIAIRQTANTRDIRGEDLQDELLKALEGEIVQTRYGPLNTQGILFVCAGAFDGLDKIIYHRVGGKRSAGFTSSSKTVEKSEALLHQVTPDDLIKYGFKKELLGRLGSQVVLDRLTPDQLKRIMTDAKESFIEERKILFRMAYGVDLRFEDSAYDAIAQEAYSRGTGARAITQITTTTLRGMRESSLIRDGMLNITGNIVLQQLKKYSE